MLITISISTPIGGKLKKGKFKESVPEFALSYYLQWEGGQKAGQFA